MSLALKHSARITGLRPEILFAIVVAEGVWRDRGLGPMTVTSCTDGKHGTSSKHYIGSAFDVRTRDLTQEKVEMAAADLKDRLGTEFDVVVEGDHIHTEHDPKQPTGVTA